MYHVFFIHVFRISHLPFLFAIFSQLYWKISGLSFLHQRGVCSTKNLN